MNEINQDQLKAAQAYIRAATQLIGEGKNEQVIRDHFTSHLRTIFPAIPTWVTEHVLGGEAALRTRQRNKITNGFVDNLIGLTAIEYEGNLTNPAKFSEGYEQVRKYCASLANDGNDPSQIMGVLSDTVRWHAYSIRIVGAVQGAPIQTENITLQEVEAIDVSTATGLDARRLIEFLFKYIQRLGSRPLDASSIARDLGFNSAFCERHLAMFSGVVDDAFTERPEYAALIKELWCSYVSFVNARGEAGAFDVHEYTRELYILTLGKLICANAIENKSLLSDDAELADILSGAFFRNRGLDNFVEYDYFGWLNGAGSLQARLLVVARGIQQDLQAYDFAQIPSEDIFGQLMAQLAERSQRILLGQEWTPTWLARALVQNTISKLPEDAQLRFIDMCCGSGAMILETIRQAKERIEANDDKLNEAQKVQLLTHSITGFDIDPLAVMLSKISWVLAAKDWLLPLGTHRIVIPIYHADSLFATTPLSQEIVEDGQKISLKLADRALDLPAFLISAGWQGVFDAIVDRAYALAIQSAEPNLKMDEVSEIVEHVLQYAPEQLSAEGKELLITFLSELIDTIYALHKEGRNGIWAFILRNNYRPGLVAGQFNGLVSNPPWLALSKIADNPYKVALTRMAEDLGIKPQGASFLHLEMATIFLLRSIDRYLQTGAVIGCVVPEAVLNGNQHNLFREGVYEHSQRPVNFAVNEIWQVDERAFKNRAAVLFGEKEPSVNATTIQGKHITQDGMTTPLEFHKATFGSRTVWTDREVADAANMFHPADFEQGADVMPRRLFFHEVASTPRAGMLSLAPIEQGVSALTFLVNDAKQSKDFRLSTPCVVREQYVFDVLLSKLLSPFRVAHAVKAFLPIKKSAAGEWSVLSEAELRRNPDDAVALAAFTSITTEIGKLDGAESATLENVWSRINFRNKIGKQTFGNDGYLVFTGAGGSDVCSAFIPLNIIPSDKLLIDQTLYWAWVANENEAVYLSGMLNSEAANELIKAFQPRGQQGERHIHELAFGITPPFDPAQEVHAEVVRITKALLTEYDERIKSAEQNGEEFIQWLNPGKDLARRRSKLREIIMLLPSYEAYTIACRSVYGV